MLKQTFLNIKITNLVVLAVIFASSAMATTIGTVDYNYVKGIEGKSDVLLIDVRAKSEIEETGSIPGSINIPTDTLSKALGPTTTNDEFSAQFAREKPLPTTKIVFTCRSGKRARQAAEQAVGLGYTNVWVYEGSWLDWAEHEKLPKK